MRSENRYDDVKTIRKISDYVCAKRKNFSNDSPCVCPRRSRSKSFALEHRLSPIEILSLGIRRNKISTLSSSPLQITECYRSTDYYEFRCHC